jgi:hypothetical protein
MAEIDLFIARCSRPGCREKPAVLRGKPRRPPAIGSRSCLSLKITSTGTAPAALSIVASRPMVIELIEGWSTCGHWAFGASPGPVRVVIGTAVDCHWRVAGPGIAAHHLHVHWTGDALWVAPAGQEPVFVDSQRLGGWTQLGRGATIQFGVARLLVVAAAPVVVDPALRLDPNKTVILRREPTPPPVTLAPAAGALDSLFVSPPPSPRGFRRRRSRPLVVIGLAGLAAAVAAAVWFEEAQARSAMRAAARPVVTAIDQPAVDVARPSAKGGVLGRAQAHEAAQLILSGREEQALESYRRLAREPAGQPVFSVIARVLEQRIEARCGSQQNSPCPSSSSP